MEVIDSTRYHITIKFCSQEINNLDQILTKCKDFDFSSMTNFGPTGVEGAYNDFTSIIGEYMFKLKPEKDDEEIEEKS